MDGALAQNIGYVVGGGLVIAVAVATRFALGSLILFTLFLAHAMVGSVELGTDSWIESITGSLFSDPVKGKILFFWTSAIMFGLRFCAHFIERTLKLSPVGILLASSLIAFLGLTVATTMQTFAAAFVALGLYALGKTFFWPTMLAVVGDRYPRSGAVAMSIMGGIGMLSVGLMGGPGLGYAKDRFTAQNLKDDKPAVYEASKSATESKFFFLDAVKPVDGKKLVEAKEAANAGKATADQKAIVAANQAGDRATLRADSYIPLTMAAIYLGLLLYFKTIGGYKPVTLAEAEAEAGKA
jgi:hypothetical protein